MGQFTNIARISPFSADDHREGRVEGGVRGAEEDGRAVALHGQRVSDHRHRKDLRGLEAADRGALQQEGRSPRRVLRHPAGRRNVEVPLRPGLSIFMADTGQGGPSPGEPGLC